MADSNGKSVEIVTDAVVIAHLECCANPDGSYKFKSLRPDTFNGRSCQLFEAHPDLRAECKRFDNRIKRVKKRLRHFESLSDARLPKRS